MVYVHIHAFQNKQIGKKISKMETEMIFSSGGLPPLFSYCFYINFYSKHFIIRKE